MKKLDNYEFRRGPGPQDDIDWAKLFDGNVWQLEAGTDYTVQPQSMRSIVHDKAKEHGGKARTNLDRETGILVLQFTKGDG